MDCGGTFDIESSRQRATTLEERMAAPGFWDHPDEAKKVVADLKRTRRVVEDWTSKSESLETVEEMLALAESETDESMLRELSGELDRLETQIGELELRSLLSGEYDRLGALVSIHPGAGGTESQDWAEMLFRMYTRWAERHSYDTQVLDLQPGEEAGVKDATFEITGDYAYGYL